MHSVTIPCPDAFSLYNNLVDFKGEMSTSYNDDLKLFLKKFVMAHSLRNQYKDGPPDDPTRFLCLHFQRDFFMFRGHNHL